MRRTRAPTLSRHPGNPSGKETKVATWETKARSNVSYSALRTKIGHGDKREVGSMASTKQRQAAKRNVKRAQAGARSKRTLANLPKETRRDLGRQAAKARKRGGQPGHSLEDRTRQELYEAAKKKNIPGRSKMGKWDLIKALRKT
jgi:hypothetical protein